ncbi:PREDICTED: uncharacterized protein LOC105967181 [Erythranthe guttata]|uniref:uncharacterized protein LOC105967181 n=1 Tax=Erythranthe guttata TaxID=4155 RepID=UPI00064E12C7|nr:PREDICTED: uncharacterized protein LOC105967181 [Erythranthe guttata]|eukprot:XP_012847223.1 PREDICTED: uncharacterized protein LOC105967181 [Erythranthe guttata]
MVKGRGEISRFRYDFANLCISSCNGLTLEHYISRADSQYCIANPATNRHFYLPPFPTSFTHELHCSAIAYTAASMVYKVVCPGIDKTSKSTVCAILTVGVDSSWRYVQTEHLSPDTKRLLLKNPLTDEGFLHWPEKKGTHIPTLNVETEIITETRVPPGCNGKELMYYLSSGRSLTVLVQCSGFSWDVWELTKPENGEWTKIGRIDLEGRKWKFEELVIECGCNTGPFALWPVGWLNYAQVLVLHISYLTQVCILYNVVSQEIDFVDMGRVF